MKKITIALCLLASTMALASGDIKKTQDSFFKSTWGKVQNFAHNLGTKVGFCEDNITAELNKLDENTKNRRLLEIAIRKSDPVAVRSFLVKLALTPEEKKAYDELSSEVVKIAQEELKPSFSSGDKKRLAVSGAAFVGALASEFLLGNLFNNAGIIASFENQMERSIASVRYKRREVGSNWPVDVAPHVAAVLLLGTSVYQLACGLTKHDRMVRLKNAFSIRGMLRDSMNPSISRA